MERVNEVSSEVSLTVAVGTTPPVESETMPSNAALARCAASRGVKANCKLSPRQSDKTSFAQHAILDIGFSFRAAQRSRTSS